MPIENWINDYVFTISDLLTPERCEELIQFSEDCGFEAAVVSSPTGNVVAKGLRNNQRVMVKDPELAERLWEQVEDFIPHEFEGRRAQSVNEMFRFYKYEPGQKFDWHQDFPVELDDGSSTVYTFMIYLNEGFEGGETSFEDSYSEESFEPVSVSPVQGMALLFEHEIHHKGEVVTEGEKYVLRTDIFYTSEDEEDEHEESWGDDDSLDDQEWD